MTCTSIYVYDTLYIYRNNTEDHSIIYTRYTISVERPSTVGSSTEARDLVVLDRELVVVSDLLSHGDVSLGVDDNLLEHPKVDHLGIAVGLHTKCDMKQIIYYMNAEYEKHYSIIVLVIRGNNTNLHDIVHVSIHDLYIKR